MAIQEVIDSVRRTIHQWVNTITPLKQDIYKGDKIIYVKSSNRFQIGDQVMVKNNSVYETGLVISSIDDDNNIIELASEVLNDWSKDDAYLIKTIHEQFVQGIYIGDPEVIPMYPAITVNGTGRESSWMTLEATKEVYDLEIAVYVRDSTHEKGYRFLLDMIDTIQTGLKRNIIPLVNDFKIISLSEDASKRDVTLSLSEIEPILDYRRIILEDDVNLQENSVKAIVNKDSKIVHLAIPLCADFLAEDTSVIIPRRYIFNSWPKSIDYGKVHKGGLLKAGVIRWFAEEQEMQHLRRYEKYLK